MKKASSQPKPITKGKSMSTIHPYQQSRVTNRSNDTHKLDSKVSKTSKTTSVVRLHQPLTIEHRTTNIKESHRPSSRVQSSELPQSRKKIQSQLESKNLDKADNPMSFRQTETKGGSVKTRETGRTQEDKGRVESRIYQVSDVVEKQNRELKEKLLRMQQSALQDKEKIKALITRISQMKRNQLPEQSTINQMSKSKTTASYANILRSRAPTHLQPSQSSHVKHPETPFRILQPSASQYSKQKQICGNPLCEERRRHLEGELYKERIKRDELEEEKREWERNREQLKRQYAQMLGEIQELRNES